MKRLVITIILLLAIILNACGVLQEENNADNVEKETTTIAELTTQNIMVTETSKTEIEFDSEKYEFDNNIDVAITEDNYKEIILSLCKKENKYDYLLTENMKRKVETGVIDFNALNNPIYNSLQVFDYIDDYHSNFNQHIVCISIDYMDDVYDGVQNTYYYTLKYFTDDTSTITLIDDIVIINQVSYFSGANSYAPEYFFLMKMMIIG